MNKSIVLWSLAVAATSLFGSSHVSAQTWALGSSGGNWGDTMSWTPATVPNGAGVTANLTAALSVSQSDTDVELNNNTYTVGILNIGNTAPGNAGYFGLNHGTLTFNNNGAGAQVNDVANAAGEQINNVVFNLADNLSINDNQNTNAATPIYGFEFGYGQGTSVTGTGNLSINDNNPVGGSNPNGWAAMGIYGSVNNVGKLSFNGTGTGLVEIEDSVGSNVTEIDQNTATSNTSLKGGLSGTAPIKITAGTLGFSGGSGFDKPTSVIIGDTAADGANSVLDIRNIGGWTTGSAQTVSGFGTIFTPYANQTVTTVAGTTLLPGSTGHMGKLSISTNLSLAGGTNLTFDLGSSGNSSILAVGDALTLPTLALNLTLVDNAGADSLGSLGAGTYELASYGSLAGVTAAGDITSLFNITAPAGYTYDITDTGVGAGQIDLVVAAAPEPNAWAMMLGGLGILFGLRTLRRSRV